MRTLDRGYGHSVLCGSSAENCVCEQRPNILMIVIDDLGRTDLQVDGSTFYETPKLDALAASGVRFTDFYSAHPVCSPTRAALMTGKVPQRWESPIGFIPTRELL